VRTQKVSVTLAADALGRARQIAGPRGLSSFLDEALQEKLEREARRLDFLDYLEELEANDPTPYRLRQRAARRAGEIRDSVSS
jgi:hypothetical protein